MPTIELLDEPVSRFPPNEQLPAFMDRSARKATSANKSPESMPTVSVSVFIFRYSIACYHCLSLSPWALAHL